ncbi:dTDP-fucosamine acetyltransferase [compost metagenome]
MQSLQSLISVRPVKEEDFEHWLEYWKSYQAFYEVDLSARTTEATWRRFFDTKEPMYCAVATDSRKIHGFVNFLYHRSTWAESNFCYLEDLYVSPYVRGQQIGKKLIEHVQRQARERNCARLYWHTQETNHRAQRLYDWVADKPGVIEYRIDLDH